MGDEVYVGNADDDADVHRGWLLGHFIDTSGGVRCTTDLEVKWGIHPAGQSRTGWTNGEDRSTMLMLIDGRFHLELSTGSHTLSRRGDYVVWGPGIEHTWRAEEDSIMLTVRWPSVPT
jgi:uncharacterized cupin superfamily protein